MIETSAHLIDHVIPPVPTRQWVLSFPWPLRFLYARRPAVLTRTLGVITRAIETDLIHRRVAGWNMVFCGSNVLAAVMNFTQLDAAPEELLNEIVWKSIRGEESEMPRPHTNRAWSGLPDDD